MVVPATSETRKTSKWSKRKCHVCQEVIPAGDEATKVMRSSGDPRYGGGRVLFWFCAHHSKLFLDVLNWEDEG